MFKPMKRAIFLIFLFVIFPSVMGFADDFLNPEPDMGPGGMIVDLTLVNPLESFGTYNPYIGNKVIMSDDGGATWTLPGEVPIYSWAEDKIRIIIPPISVLTPTWPAYIKVIKDGTQSYIAPFLLTYPPRLLSLNPDVGIWGTFVVLDGDPLNGSFTPIGNKQYGCWPTAGDGPLDCCYTYVELHASNDDYRVKPSKYSGVGRSTMTVQLDGMLDIRTNNPVPNAQEFYPGNWQLNVVTDYFTDPNGLGAVNYFDASGRIDTANFPLKHRIRSSHQTFVVTYASDKPVPIIYELQPISSYPAGIISVFGNNFGDTQGASTLHIANMTFDSGNPRIKFWSDTEIQIKSPNRTCEWFMGKNFRYVSVWLTVNGIDSNIKQLKVLKPNSCP